MCLGVPGKVLRVDPDPLGMAMGRVNFAGIVKKVCFAYTPEVEPGDYVVVHVGFAISKIDPDEAEEMYRFLREAGELDELEAAPPPPVTA